MSGRYLSIMARLRSIGGFCSLGSSDRYSMPPISSLKVRLASATIAGFFRHSTIAAAITLAPASAPLWAIEVARGTPAAQWWKLMCGIARRKIELDHRYFPGDVAGIIGGRLLHRRTFQYVDRALEPFDRDLRLGLHGTGEVILLPGPVRDAEQFDLPLEKLSERAVAAHRPHRTDHVD